jgi:glycosyltransferase involved in cell wall biosynthesis
MSGEPLKIAYSFPTRLGSPGIGAAALSQIEALAARGCAVDVFCWTCPEDVKGVKLTQIRNIAPIPQRFLGRQLSCELHDYIVAILLKYGKTTYDVIHTWPLGAERTLRVARSRGALGVREAPNTHTAHAFDVVAKEHKALGFPQEKAHTHTYNQKLLDRELREYEEASLILAPSELAIKTFVQFGVERNKIALKSYGFDPLCYKSSAGAHKNDALTFSFVARCEPRKGLHLGLEAWLKSGVADRTRFKITGRFVPGYRERIESLLQHPNIIIQDFVSDLRPLYESTDVLVLPSVEDGSALVTYEAQAAGCALLVSDASGARLTDGVEGFMHHAGDSDALANHMRMLAEDPALLLRMQQAAPLNAEKYTWDRATENLVDSYEQALSAMRAK